ncbi:hypothetical protein DFJ73DRAFT_832242 [Zopfochytrium polystomum]|nr:hypothetical protein DFJ73DRAFT_832242 [Zopfochytrium polystomum]
MGWTETVGHIAGTPDEFKMDQVALSAVNWNLVPLEVGASADLEVFVKSEAGVGSESELLGHVTTFEPVRFHPLTGAVTEASLMVKNPRNTIGKIVYMFHPYSVTVRGTIYYNTWFGLVEYAVPVCSVHRVESADDITSASCR